jgi:hypothetical protein
LLSDLDKNNLKNLNDFDIFMKIIKQKNKDVARSVDAAFMVLDLIFPLYEISVRENLIILKQNDKEYSINANNFNEFKKIISATFNLKIGEQGVADYNPSGDMSQRIANKLKKRHDYLNKMKNNSSTENNKKISILSRYASILAVGLQKDFNDLMQYTVYQLYNEFQRFQLKVQWDAFIQAKMAGAQDLEDVDKDLAELIFKGVESYTIYAPVVSLTMRTFSPPELTLKPIGSVHDSVDCPYSWKAARDIEIADVIRDCKNPSSNKEWKWIVVSSRSTPSADGSYTWVIQFQGIDDVDSKIYEYASGGN